MMSSYSFVLAITFISNNLLHQNELFSQFKQNASPGTLVKTVEENVRILITVGIVKISATVMRTDVISQPDVQILQKVLYHFVH